MVRKNIGWLSGNAYDDGERRCQIVNRRKEQKRCPIIGAEGIVIPGMAKRRAATVLAFPEQRSLDAMRRGEPVWIVVFRPMSMRRYSV